MSTQEILSNSDQHSEDSVLEQLWYTWSAIGLGPLSAGFRIRAASPGLSDVRSPDVQALDRYLRYVLPQGTDPFAITPNMAPICLSLIKTEHGEWILVNKTYTGRDGVGRPGAFFVHLLSNFPADFSAAQAISLWRSPFFRSTDIDQNSGVQLSGTELNTIRFNDLKQWIPSEIDIMHPKGIDKLWMHDCLPLVIQAYLMWRRRWEQWKQHSTPGRQATLQSEIPRLYLAAPSDMVAAFIQGIARCLPQQLLNDLTFSTYEYDVRSKDQVLFVGTAWAPSASGEININQDLPPACYQNGVALNCYNYDESKTRLENDSLAISYAAYATRCLETNNFDEIDWLFSEKIALTANLNVSSFLQIYDSYIVKAQNPTRKDVELFIIHADPDMLSRIHVRTLILKLAIQDPSWLKDFLIPCLTSLYEQSKTKTKLGNALAQLANDVSEKAAEAIDSDAINSFNDMLNILCLIADQKSEIWRRQPHFFATKTNFQPFLTKYPEAHLRLLKLWNQLIPPLPIDEVYPFLNVPERIFEEFYNYNLPSQWKYTATETLITSVLAQGAVAILGQKYRKPIADLMQYFSPNSWNKAFTLFEQLAERNYPDKLVLLSYLLDVSTNLSKDKVEQILKKAKLQNDEYESYLIEYGPRYLPSIHREIIVLQPFRKFVINDPNSKLRILRSWFQSESLVRWLEEQPTGPGNLDEVFRTATLDPKESNIFIENYGKYFLERYYQQYPVYKPSPLILEYLSRYIDSFNPKSLWQTSSVAYQFFLFLHNSPVQQSLSERERRKIQQWYNLINFFMHPSASIKEVKTLGGILHELDFNRNLQLIERLAEAFVFCITSATELASVTYIMSTLITEAELLQMLYSMAENMRDRMIDRDPHISQSATALLEVYVELALCFESVYNLSSADQQMATDPEGIHRAMKETLFLQTYLNILLKNAPQNMIEIFDQRSKTSGFAYWKKWKDYTNLNSSASMEEYESSYPYSGELSRKLQPGGRLRNNLSAFLEHPSTSRRDVEAMQSLLSVRLVGDPIFVENLAAAFSSCIESETEITSIIFVLQGSFSRRKTHLLQMLYSMAENIRNNLSNGEEGQRAEAMLGVYIRFVLCIESVFEFSDDEESLLFIRTFLNLLLQAADTSTFQQLDIKFWPTKLVQTWQAYMPHNFPASSIRQVDMLKREPSSTMSALSPQKQAVSHESLSKNPTWFTKLKEWLAEDAFSGSNSGPTTLERQKKRNK